MINIDNLTPKFTDSDYYVFKEFKIDINPTDTYKILAMRINELLKNKSIKEAMEIHERLFFDGGDITRIILKMIDKMNKREVKDYEKYL